VVYDIVRHLPADLVMLAHHGCKAYGDRFELVYRREAAQPNAIWQADHTRLDILVLREDGSAIKPWLSLIIDDYSRAIAGYFLSFEAPCVPSYGSGATSGYLAQRRCALAGMRSS